MVSTADKQAQKVRTAVFFRNSILSVQSIDYAFDYPQNLLSQDSKGTRCIVTGDTLMDNERVLYEDLCETLGIEPNNYGTVSYDENNSFTFFSYPMIGLKDGKAVLMVGADVGKDWKAGYLDLVRDGEAYRLGKAKVSLVSVKTEIATIPFIAVKSKAHIFYINLKTDKETTYEHIDHAWDNGEVELYLNPLSKSAVKFSNMFKLLFDSNAFPDAGILMTWVRGKIKNPPEGKTWEKTSQWSIETIPPNYAELPVLDMNGNTVNFGDCGTIFVPSSSSATKSLISKGENGIERMYVYVSGKHATGNTHWIPSHTTATQAARLPINVQNTFQSQIKALLMPKSEGSTNASEQTVETVATALPSDSGSIDNGIPF